MTDEPRGHRVRLAAGLRCPAVIGPDFLQATRASYDAIAGDYAEQFREELASKPSAHSSAGSPSSRRPRGRSPTSDADPAA
jgi:hypothetical protein